MNYAHKVNRKEKMTIILISVYSAYLEDPVGGAEISMRLLAEHLAARGHKVVYVSKDHKGGFIPRVRRKAVNGVTVYLLRLFRGERLIRPIKTINDYLFMLLVKRIIRKYNAQIAYSTYDLDMPTLLLKLRHQVCSYKIVLRMAGMYWSEACVKNPLARQAYEKIFNEIDAINYVSPGLADMVEQKIKELGMKVNFKHSFTADIGTVLPPGRSRSYIDLNNDNFTMVMAARFSRYQKRQDLLVRAVSLIDPTLPVHLYLVGDGKNRQDIQQLIQQLNLVDRISIIPFMKQNDLWQLMLRADLLCHACDYEGTSKIILESMALGLPMLVSNVAPVSDYVKNGVTGFLVANEPEAWAEKIKWLITAKAARASVSQNAMEYIAANFNPVVNAAVYEQHFASLID